MHGEGFDEDDGDRWFLMEDAPARDAASRDSVFTAPIDFLRGLDHTAAVLVGDELLEGESLVRFDVIVAASDLVSSGSYELSERLESESVELTLSVWFARDGDVRRILLDHEEGGSSITVEVWSRTLLDPVEIDVPASSVVESFNELQASNEAS